MAQIFPRWTNKVPGYIAAGVFVIAVSVIAGIWYYGSPEFTDVGYRPVQPVPYSHKLHAGEFGFDCRYCHASVETAAAAIIPPTQTCMNCHKVILPKSEKLRLIRESFDTGKPIEWIRVHKLPDYVYFNHSAHVTSGIGCASCHGYVNEMEIVTQVEPLSMGWCLECHRNPDQRLRPLHEVTNMKWTPPENQAMFASQMMADKNIAPPEDCSGCHR